MNDLIQISLRDQIASKRFAYDAVTQMAYHPAKAATLKRIDKELAALQAQLVR